MDKNIHCSCRGSKFRFQHSHWSAYNYLYFQFQEIQPLLVALTCTAHIHAGKLTHMKDPPKPETNNKNFKRKKKWHLQPAIWVVEPCNTGAWHRELPVLFNARLLPPKPLSRGLCCWTFQGYCFFPHLDMGSCSVPRQASRSWSQVITLRQLTKAAHHAWSELGF